MFLRLIWIVTLKIYYLFVPQSVFVISVKSFYNDIIVQ